MCMNTIQIKILHWSWEHFLYDSTSYIIIFEAFYRFTEMTTHHRPYWTADRSEFDEGEKDQFEFFLC